MLSPSTGLGQALSKHGFSLSTARSTVSGELLTLPLPGLRCAPSRGQNGSHAQEQPALKGELGEGSCESEQEQLSDRQHKVHMALRTLRQNGACGTLAYRECSKLYGDAPVSSPLKKGKSRAQTKLNQWQ